MEKTKHSRNGEYRLLVIEALGSKCFICGSKKQLNLHHIKHTKKPHLENIEILCWNCHGLAHTCVCSDCGLKHKRKAKGTRFHVKKRSK